MESYRIFVSSPGDVGKERHLAEQVIGRVAAEFQDRGQVEPYFWEYEPMESTRDYHENIPLTSEFDLVVTILWKRLGTPLHAKHQRPGGGRWRSGTEFELVTAVESKKQRGVPDLFIFKNDTRPTFEVDEESNGRKAEQDLAQWKALVAFIKEWCEQEQDGQKVLTAALNRYTELSQFEQTLEKLLRQKLQERFGAKPGTESRAVQRLVVTWTAGSPFRGLEAFEFQHSAVFCGRTRAIGEVIERLQRQAQKGKPFVLILGASGSGKSSLVMAGVLPLLVRPGTIEGIGLWRRVIFRPGEQTGSGDLFDRFAAALLRHNEEGEGLPELISDGTPPARLAEELRSNPGSVATSIRLVLSQAALLHKQKEIQQIQNWIEESKDEGRRRDTERYERLLANLMQRETRLALVIDQCEELFLSDDLNQRPALREKFTIALDALVHSGRVFVLVTLRSDFYPRLQSLAAFIDLKNSEGQFDLPPPNPAEIAQVIRQPAAAAGLRFEKDPNTDHGLDEVLADEVKAEPRLLPLLEFALDELYKERNQNGVLTFDGYRRHLDGSIVRALARRADATLEKLPHDWQREAFRSVMCRLATALEGDTKTIITTGSATSVPSAAFQRQRVPYSQLTAYPPGAKGLVDAFVGARLLVVEGGDNQEPEVTVAHEALFEHWAKLRELLVAERNDLILPRARVTACYERWKSVKNTSQKGLDDYLLPVGKQLAEAEHLLAHYGAELTPEVTSYINASMARAEAQRRRRQRQMGIAVGVSAFLAVVSGLAAVFGFWQKGEAEKQKVKAERQSFAAMNASFEAQKEADHARLALSRSDFFQAVRLIQSDGANDALAYLVRSLSVSPQNNEAALTRIVSLLTYHTWLLPIAALEHDGKVMSAQFSPDGKLIVTASFDKTARVWDAHTGEPVTPPMHHSDVVQWAEFSVDGKRVVTTCGYNALVWDVQTGEPTPRMHHRDYVEVAQFSPDGKRVVTASLDGTARVWDAQTGEAITPPMVHAMGASWAEFSPDGKRVVTASEDKTARVWDAQTGEAATQPMWHNDYVIIAQFSPDGKRVVTGSYDKTARVWDAQTGEPVMPPIQHHGLVWFARFSPDGKRILTASDDKTTQVWNAQTGEPIAAPMQHVWSVQVNPDWKRILTSSVRAYRIAEEWDRIWDADTSEPLTEPMQHDGPGFRPQLSPDGKQLVTRLNDRAAQICDARIGKALAVRLKHDGEVLSAEFSPDCKLVVTASADKTVRVWDAQTGKPVTPPMDHLGVVWSARFSPDGKRIVTASFDKTARVWDAQTGEPVTPPMHHLDVVQWAEFSVDGKRVVTASRDGTARVWDAQTGEPVTPSIQHSGSVWSARFSPDGKRIVTASGDLEGTARVWDAGTGKPLTPPMQHDGRVSSARFSPDGKRIVTASEDMTARVWNAESGEPVNAPMEHHDVVHGAQFSPDGKRVLTISSHEAFLWDTQTGEQVTPPMEHDASVYSAEFSADGKRIVTASRDKTARVWDAETGQPLTEPLKHDGAVNSVQISMDGESIATASDDGIARIWNIRPSSSKWPDWLPEISEVFCGEVLNEYGVLQPKTKNRMELLEQLREKLNHGPDNDKWVIWGRWLLEDRSVRTISPSSKVTTRQYIENLIKENTKESLREAELLAGDDEDLLECVALAREALEPKNATDAQPSQYSQTP